MVTDNEQLTTVTLLKAGTREEEIRKKKGYNMTTGLNEESKSRRTRRQEEKVAVLTLVL